MGLEATCIASLGAETGSVKALLESSEMILRGDIRRRIALADIRAAQVDGEHLRLVVGGDEVRLHLGATQAARWAVKITTPPPSLRAKLGLADGATAFIAGQVADASLAGAIAGAATRQASDAAMAVAEVSTPAELEAAMLECAALPAGAPIWVVHGKGRGTPFGEGAVRACMRAAGFVDTKVSAVSETRSATRYSRKE